MKVPLPLRPHAGQWGEAASAVHRLKCIERFESELGITWARFWRVQELKVLTPHRDPWYLRVLAKVK